MDILTIVMLVTTILGAGATIALKLGNSKLAKLLEAVVLGINEFARDFPKTAKETKESIKKKATEMGVEESLNKEVKKLEDV